MEQEKQIQAVKRALELERAIQSISKDLRRINNERFREQPQPPVKQTVTRTVPPIRPTIQFNWVLAVLLLFFTSGVGTLIYYFGFYKPKRKAEIEQIARSDAYQQKYLQAKAEFDRMQKELDEQYSREMEQYQTVILSEYHRSFAAWTEQHNTQVNAYQARLEKAKGELEELYLETRIIPVQYRTIPALQYIYDMISTSDYTIQEAIESYDKQEQRKLDTARLQEQRQANQLAYEQNQLAYEKNDLLDRQNEIAQKARRDANIASVVSAAQRHSTNKVLKQLNKK